MVDIYKIQPGDVFWAEWTTFAGPQRVVGLVVNVCPWRTNITLLILEGRYWAHEAGERLMIRQFAGILTYLKPLQEPL